LSVFNKKKSASPFVYFRHQRKGLLTNLIDNQQGKIVQEF